VRVRTFVLLAGTAWVGRWLALELASRAGHRWLPPGAPPLESARPPGWTAGSADR